MPHFVCSHLQSEGAASSLPCPGTGLKPPQLPHPGEDVGEAAGTAP